MWIMISKHGRVTKLTTPEALARIAKMSMPELVSYEAKLWEWQDALQKSRVKSERIVDMLNAIYREVEWRAGQKEWDDAEQIRGDPDTRRY